MELVKETKREKRKRNVIIMNENKERRNGRVEKKVEEIVNLTRAVAKVEGIKEIGKKDKNGREMVWDRFKNVEKKLEVIKGTMKLKNKKE